MFLRKFLQDELSLQWGTSVEALNATEGFKIKCPLRQDIVEFKLNDGHWWNHHSVVNGFNVDFTKDILSLEIKDDMSLTTNAVWSFKKEATVEWSATGLMDGSENHGGVDLRVTVDQVSNPA